jgi:hypothetical protein
VSIRTRYPGAYAAGIVERATSSATYPGRLEHIARLTAVQVAWQTPLTRRDIEAWLEDLEVAPTQYELTCDTEGWDPLAAAQDRAL